jgi:hypothetical protein
MVIWAMVSLGRWIERRMNEAEFRRVQREWQEDVAERLGFGPKVPVRKRPGAHRKTRAGPKHRRS